MTKRTLGHPKKRKKRKEKKKRHEIEIHAGALKSHKRWPAKVITPCAPPQKDVPLMLD